MSRFIEALECREFLSASPIHSKAGAEVIAADKLAITSARAQIKVDQATYAARLKSDHAAIPLARKNALALIRGAQQAIHAARGDATAVASAKGELLIAKGRLKSDVADAVAQIKTTQGEAKIALASDKVALQKAIATLRLDRFQK